MKSLFIATGLLSVASVITFVACKKEVKGDQDRELNAGVLAICPTKTLTGNVTAGNTLKLDKDTIYLIDHKLFIDSLAKIEIEAGTKIKGIKYTTPADASALVVKRGGKIIAKGVSCNPIVFTSNEATPAAGDWGGVVILGGAPTNQANPTIEGIVAPVHYGAATPGAGNPTDSSGEFTYVRIEYAGASVTPNNELNGLTLGGVGSKTVIHHVEVAWGRDDAFEFFGGTVNASYLVALAPNDDMFDFDFGYQGAIQFALGIRSQCCYSIAFADANGIESDNNNDGGGSGVAPITRPVISNMTLIGGETAIHTGTLNGERWRRNSNLHQLNSVVMGYSTGVSFESAYNRFVVAPLNNDPSAGNFYNNIVHGFTAAFAYTPLPSLNVNGTNTSSTAANANTDIQLNAPFDCGNLFDPSPSNISPARLGASFASLAGSGALPSAIAYINQTVTYRGAFPQDDTSWLDCWTNCVGYTPPVSNCTN